MSHSFSDPERGWDYGMKNEDYVAFVPCEKSGNRPIDWTAGKIVQYISVTDLRKAQKHKQIKSVKPKGAQEGFEARIIWPSAIASAVGTIKKVTSDSLQFIREGDGRTIPLRLKQKNGIRLRPLVRVGEKVNKNQIIASVIPVYQSFPSKRVNDKYFLDKLDSTALTERYAAAKALSYFRTKKVEEALLGKLEDSNEHIYVKLEAAASLARFDVDTGYKYIKKCLDDTYLQNVLEAVIVLAEIRTEKSCEMLCSV